MTYDEFREAVKTKFMHEAIYNDSEGREILVIRTLDAYSMMRRIKPWVSLTDDEKDEIWGNCLGIWDVLEDTQKKLQEKNNT